MYEIGRDTNLKNKDSSSINTQTEILGYCLNFLNNHFCLYNKIKHIFDYYLITVFLNKNGKESMTHILFHMPYTVLIANAFSIKME